MLPYIIGAVATFGIGALLKSSQDSTKAHYASRLDSEHSRYQQRLDRREAKMQAQKRSKILSLLHMEIKGLKKEYSNLLSMLTTTDINSSIHIDISYKLEELDRLIYSKKSGLAILTKQSLN